MTTRERKRALGVYADWQGFDETVGRLKRAMIDAFMAEKVFGSTFGHGGFRFEIKDGEYRLQSPGPFEGDKHVARPDEYGVGGGNAWENYIGEIGNYPLRKDSDMDYTAEFDDIRSWLDDLIAPWINLPDPEKIGEVATQFNDACTKLKKNGGTISGHVSQLNDDLKNDNLAGSTIEAFRTKFVVNMKTVLNGHSGIAAILASSMAAQQGEWEEARASFILTLEKYTTVFRALSKLKGVQKADIMVKVLSYAAYTAAGGPWAGLLNIASDTLGLWILKKDEPSSEDKQSPASFAEGKEALAGALNALNNDIFAIEKKIVDNISYDMGHISSPGGKDADGNPVFDNRTDYDITLAPVTDFVIANPGLIGQDGDVIHSIVNDPMKAIAEGLHDTLVILTGWDEEISRRVKRDMMLGLGTYGPSSAVHDLNEMLCDLLRDLKWAVETGADQLWLAYEANMNNDSQAAADLAALNAGLPGGSGYDPWDVERPQADVLTVPQVRKVFLPIWKLIGDGEFNPDVDYWEEYMEKPKKVEQEPTKFNWQELGS